MFFNILKLLSFTNVSYPFLYPILFASSIIKSVLYKPIADKDKNTIEKILKASQKFFNVIAYIFIGYLIVLSFIYPYFVHSNPSSFAIS